MMRIAVLASTNGTDMDALVGKNPDYTLALVLCNKECGALDRAQQHNIPCILIPSRGMGREEYDREVMRALEEARIDLVVLIGYMRLLSDKFVGAWRNRIMNIHPSLLPAFAGGMDTNVHEQVLERGCKITGCTLHFVDEGADTGPIILQKSVEVADDETVETLKAKVQRAEREIIAQGVALYAQGKLRVEHNQVVFA